MLENIALVIILFVTIVLLYGMIAIHDIPYEIARQRNHPHQDAIHVTGWISLFTLHVIWPFLWIWATLYRQDNGFERMENQIAGLAARLDILESGGDGPDGSEGEE